MLGLAPILALPLLGRPSDAGGAPKPPGGGGGEFTVSGGFVNLTFREFFFDVSFTDAAICKRTN